MLDVTRHMELFNPYDFNTPVTIIGAGATGSWLALMLAKLGIKNITVYDFDVVEEHNIPNQAYSIKDIGKLKTKALYEQIQHETNTEINAFHDKYTDQRLAGIVFLMVDSMAERKRIWEDCLKMKTAIQLVVEPRMGLDIGRIYNVNPTNLKHISEYEKTFYSDDVAEVSACGASMTVITTAITIAAWCARQLINFHNNIELDNEILIDVKYNNIVTSQWK